jgi:virginiamycin B lyase
MLRVRKTTPALRALLVASLAMLTACSGAINPTLPSTSGDGGHPSAQVQRAKGKIKLRIHVPKKHRRIRVVRHGKPAYISVATQSMSIAITGPTTLAENVGLTPTSTGCASSLTGTFCTLTISHIPAGNYTASIATYDGPLNGSNNPTGNLLSQAQNVGFTVTPGVTNSIGIVLGGVPTSVALVPDANATLSGNMNGFALSKCGSDRVAVLGVDADDNYILGAGAPAPSLTSDSATLVIASPSPSSPNVFTMTRPTTDLPAAGSVVHVTAGVTPDSSTGSSEQTQSIPLTFGGQICGVLTQYAVSGQPSDITTGPDGAMWFTESPGTVGRITTDGTITETPVAGTDQLAGITTGPDGALWFTDLHGTIDRLTTNAVVTNTYATSLLGPNAIVSGPDGQLWFNSCEGVGSVSVTGTVSEYPTSASPTEGRGDIAAGSDGALWFAECMNGQIGRVTTMGALSAFPISGGSTPRHIVAGPDGALWFNYSSGLGRVTTDGTLTTRLAPILISPSDPLVFGSDGTLWIWASFLGELENLRTDGAVGTPINSYSPYSSFTQIFAMRFGPDGALWLVNVTTHTIDRIQ